jgi:hypothetical protein
VALAIIAMAIEFSITHKIVDRTNNFIRSQTTDFGSHQPNFGADSVIRARDFIRHRTLGTCAALLYAVLFLYSMTFPQVSIPVLPLSPFPYTGCGILFVASFSSLYPGVIMP